jgi:hypothetical protein
MDAECRRVEIFTSFDQENRAEDERRAAMDVAERLREFGVLLARVRGPAWVRDRIARIAQVEQVEW